MINFTPYGGGPDGIIADEEGNLYIALRIPDRPGIGVFTPDGKERAFISTGKELPTNVGFGRGKDANLLYVTSGKSLYKIRVKKKGYQLPPKIVSEAKVEANNKTHKEVQK